MYEKRFGGPGNILLVFQITPHRGVELGVVDIVCVFQLQKLFVAHHIGRELFGDLLQDIRQGNLVEIVYPLRGIDAFSHLEGNGSLDILPVEIEVSQHTAAVSSI